MDEPDRVRAVIRRAGVMLVAGAALRALVAAWPAPPARPDAVEAALVDHAERLGWARTDPVVRRRLAEDLRFAGRDGDDAALVDEAIALGLVRADPVVRRRLAMRAEEALLGEVDAPTDAALDAWRLAHADRFTRPPVWRVRVTPPVPGLGAAHTGTADQLVRRFGAGFGAALPAGGRVATPYGDVDVVVLGQTPGGLPPLDAIRAEVAADWARAARAAARPGRIAALMEAR